uniref:ribonuclease P protein component n=1 Tax=Zhouia sp. PK063 TaxID=3373602 RepID=UPI0037DC5253
MDFTFSKKEKLKSQKLIGQLFSEGKSVTKFPLKLIYLPTTFEDEVTIKTGVSASKRNFKKAVTRNRIKRLLREAYRLNKQQVFNDINTQYAFMILYIGKDIPDFHLVDDKMKKLLEKFTKQL